MKRILPLSILFLLTFSPFLLFTVSPLPVTSAPPPPRAQAEADIQTALTQAIAAYSENVVAFLIFDVKINRIQFDRMGQWAVVWLDLYDPATGELVPTEPGLVVAYQDGRQWHIVLQADPAWADTLIALPAALMPEGNKAFWLTRYTQAQTEAPQDALTGYLLPWAAGLTKLLSRSIAHGGTGYYAFDFADGTMFPLYASKGGTVHLVEWTYPNGYDDGSCANSNYIILKDTTTSPTTYQLYLHLAHDSIPEDLRTPGAPVVQGQFIGNADDTGCSSGHHLHFHVHTNPYSYWGTALDIVFADVNINGGRPRTVTEANSPDCTPAPCTGRSTYTSQNAIVADLTPPTGGLFTPGQGAFITSPLTLEGWALDEGSGLEAAYFTANYNNTWMQIGPTFTEILFSYTWDLCQDNVPDGPISLALNVEDQAGNQATLLGLRQVLKSDACAPPPPACQPAANQIALYTEINYGGNCITLNPGTHLISLLEAGLSAAPLPDNLPPALAGGSPVASILVGDAARVTLFREINFRGRGQTVWASDPNLADNWIGTQQISLAVVAANTAPPPSAPIPAWPTGGTFTDTASLTLVWDDGRGAAEFQARYTGPGGTTTSAWGAASFWPLGSLDDGSYTWQVRARNANGTTAWSSLANFTVAFRTPAAPSPLPMPYLFGFENNLETWEKSGLWNFLEHQPIAHGGSFTAWYGAPAGNFDNGSYDTGTPNTGDLTSPPIAIPASGTPYLRFWSWQITEGGGNWDQRWVQISANGGPFTNLYQMKDDPAAFWIQSPYLDLSPYLGQTIRIRFHFGTLDERDNAHRGWLIDDLLVDNMTPPVCAPAGEPNNTPAEAGSIAYGDIVSGQICPAGDVDYFTFSGNAGAQIGVNVDANAFGSNLDPYLFLLAADGTSVVAENDDEVPFQQVDPLLGFTLPWDGDYYLKLRAWNHPGAGDENHFYTMTLFLDPDGPAITSLTPAGSLSTNFFVQADTVVPVSLNVTDAGSGVGRVDFWWHSGDWANGNWTLLGTDTDGSDGWSLPGGWNTTGIPDQLGMALYARAVDRAGNASLIAAWNLAIDRVPPQTTVVGLPPVQETTAMHLQWSSTDNIAPLREYDIQWNVNNTGWHDYQTDVVTTTINTWIIGNMGSLYGFRVRAVDQAGNLEPFNGPTNQTSTFIQPCEEPDPWDEDGNDDTFATASIYTSTQTHNFCDAGDEDWVALTLEKGISYFIATSPLDPSSAVVIELYAANGTTLLQQVFPQDVNGGPTSGLNSLGLPTQLVFKPSASGTYYVRLYHPVDGVAGAAVAYDFRVVAGNRRFLPVVTK